MKAKSLFVLFLSVAMMGLSPDLALSQLFGDDDKKWERVMMEMKKINSRLVSLKTKDLQGLEDNQAQLQQSQGEILSQIQNLQNLIPNIQGVVEQSNAAMSQQVSGFSAKLAELELALKAELQINNKSQTEAINNLKVEISAKVDSMTAKVDIMKSQVTIMKSDMSSDVNTMRKETIARLGELKEAMAADVEKINSSMAAKVDRIDQNVTRGLGTINKNLASGIETITQSNKAMLQEFSSKQDSPTAQAEAIRNHEQTVLLRFTEMDAGTQKMIDILSENLAEGRAVKRGVDDLNNGMILTNENVNINREAIAKLKTIFDTRLEEIKKGQAELFARQGSGGGNVDIINENLLVADEKINRLAETLQSLHTQNLASAQAVEAIQAQFTLVISAIQQTDEKFDVLVDATKQFAANSAQIDRKLGDMMMKFEANQAGGSGLSDEKIGDLIEILKSIADEQGNMMQRVSAQEGNLLNALNAHESNMNKALTVHEDNMTSALGAYEENITQALKVYAQALTVYEGNMIQAWSVHDKNSSEALADISASNEKSRNFHGEINNSLADLRKKSNVNISRNDDILKTLRRLMPQ